MNVHALQPNYLICSQASLPDVNASFGRARAVVVDALAGMSRQDALEALEASRQLKLAAQQQLAAVPRSTEATCMDYTIEQARQTGVKVSLLMATAGMIDGKVFDELGIPPLVCGIEAIDRTTANLYAARDDWRRPFSAREAERVAGQADYFNDNQVMVAFRHQTPFERCASLQRALRIQSEHAHHYGLIAGRRGLVNDM